MAKIAPKPYPIVMAPNHAPSPTWYCNSQLRVGDQDVIETFEHGGLCKPEAVSEQAGLN
jgi:hypothetical protein